jgi:hypothetical protein
LGASSSWFLVERELIYLKVAKFRLENPKIFWIVNSKPAMHCICTMPMMGNDNWSFGSVEKVNRGSVDFVGLSVSHDSTPNGLSVVLTFFCSTFCGFVIFLRKAHGDGVNPTSYSYDLMPRLTYKNQFKGPMAFVTTLLSRDL